MKKTFLVALVLFIGFGVYGHYSKPRMILNVRMPANEISLHNIKQAQNFTVLISVEGWEGTSRGTGVLIDPLHVLTCAHMRGEGEVWIYPVSKNVVLHGKWLYGDTIHDLAILELNEPYFIDHYATFTSSHTVGEPIVVVGNILGRMTWFVAGGVVSGDFMWYVLTDALVRGGDSGGPWIDKTGKVVALTDWGMETKDGGVIGVSGGIGAAEIQKFLDGWKHPQEGLLQILIGSLK